LGTSHAFPAQARDGAEYVNQLKVLAKRMNVRTGKLSQMLLPYGEETSTLEQAHASNVADRAGKGCEIPNFKGSSLGRFPLVSADFWTSDHLLERSRSVDDVSGTRARGTRKLKRR
jgi:hypothetical protein